MRLLYAEDDENDAFFMRRAASRLVPSVEVSVVPNGQEALNYLERKGKYADRALFRMPDVVLLDIKMPVVSGHEALKLIRAQDRFSKIAVIMFSSSSENDDIDFSRVNQANAYLVKPTDPQKMSALIQTITAAVKNWKIASKKAGLLPVWGNLLG